VSAVCGRDWHQKAGKRFLVVRLHSDVRLEITMPEPNTEIRLDATEQKLLEDVELGALQSVATAALLEDLRQSAKATGQKDQRINGRHSIRDL
jgi:hypothetical protein